MSLANLVIFLVLNYLERLNKLLGDVVISQGGVVPHINPEVCAPQIMHELALLTCCNSASPQQNPEGQEGEPGSIDFRYSLNFFIVCSVLLVVIRLFSGFHLGSPALEYLPIEMSVIPKTLF